MSYDIATFNGMQTNRWIISRTVVDRAVRLYERVGKVRTRTHRTVIRIRNGVAGQSPVVISGLDCRAKERRDTGILFFDLSDQRVLPADTQH